MKQTLQQLFSRVSKPTTARLPRKTKAQSLTEFAIALPILFLLLSGVIEFGFALNYYLSLLDATREAARLYSNGEPFLRDSSNNIIGDDMSFYEGTDADNDGVYEIAGVAKAAQQSLDPSLRYGNEGYAGRKIELNPAVDNIIVTVYSRDGNTIVQHPDSGPYLLFNNSVTSMFTNADIVSRFDSSETLQGQSLGTSPNAGILVVEVHYNYEQVMKLPWLTPFVPDPFVLSAYTMMPLVAAEPKETP